MKHFRGQPDHDYWRSPFTPRETARIWWGFSVVFAVLTYVYWRSPSKPPFSGRFAWAESLVYANFGPIGIPLFMGIIAAVSFVAGFLFWQKSNPHGVCSEAKSGK
jgi:hypothetical protein